MCLPLLHACSIWKGKPATCRAVEKPNPIAGGKISYIMLEEDCKVIFVAADTIRSCESSVVHIGFISKLAIFQKFKEHRWYDTKH